MNSFENVTSDVTIKEGSRGNEAILTFDWTEGGTMVQH